MNRSGFALSLAIGLLPLPGFPAIARRDVWGARPLALGGAFLAVEGDPSSPLWNPAALARADRPTWGAGAADAVRPEGSLGRRLGWASYADKSEDGKSGLGVWWTGDDDRAAGRRDALGLSWTREAAPALWGGRLTAGLNAKLLNASYVDPSLNNRASFGLDAGLLYARGPWALGASARDLNEPRLGGGVDRKEPASYGLGGAFRPDARTLLLLDATQTSSGEPLRARLGAERLVWKDLLTLRAGAGRDQASAGFGLGGGKRCAASLDYGFTVPFDSKKSERLHEISFSVRFGGEPPLTEGPSTPAFSSPASTAPANSLQWRTAPSRPSYPLGADDVLQITVKDHPELNVTTVVDPRGAIHLSFIEDLNVKGLSPQDLESSLQKIYGGFFTQAPSVEVTVKEYNSRVVYVVGAVKSPGKYPLKNDPLTLRDAIFMAGLPTDRAALWRVFIVRQTPKGPKPLWVNFNKIYYRGQLERDLELESGDIIYVPMGFLDTLSIFIGRIVGPIIGAARNAAVATGTGL